MKYQGKPVEVISRKKVFGQELAWIKMLEDGSFKEIALEDLEKPKSDYSIPYLEFIALAAKIKDEIAKKHLLAPYESNLIPLPHQVLVLEKVMQSPHNRFLLADEVGMGKTIETGLILKELKLIEEIKRILVITSKSSILQWQSELKEHFNELFHIYDSETISSYARTFANISADQELNFWEQHNQIIVSTDALKPLETRQGWSQERVDEYNKYRLEAVLNADFDLVIIDEAHKMGGASQTVSRYQLAQALCNAVSNVLLLTATPHRGKSDHFRRILKLLDPDAFQGEGLPPLDELEPYVIRTEKRLAVDYEGKKLFNERQTIKLDVIFDSVQHRKQIALYNAVTDYVRKGFKTARVSKNRAKGLIMVLFQRLVSSSTSAILSAMEGKLQRLQAEELDSEDYISEYDENSQNYNDLLDFDKLYASKEEGIEDEERILQDLINQAQECLYSETDAKAEALIKRYKDLKQEFGDEELKILIFTEFRTTQKMLKRILENEGYTCELINGGQEIEDRKKALINFKENAQILIATDAAGESLNMQFCYIVFNYDLPWNPMMIEQRIGRVDRIGQKNRVRAYNMLTNNTVDQRVYEVIEEKLNTILHQLGIDKTSDVLDSAIDPQNVNNLYLQSLLDPEKFDFYGDRWLNEIRGKLKDYQSTEGILPESKEEEIEYKKASEIKNSPLPLWLEKLVLSYSEINDQKAFKISEATYQFQDRDEVYKFTFDSEIAMEHPGIEHITLQHSRVKKILQELGSFNIERGLPVISSKEDYDTSGTWSLWEVKAENHFEKKLTYQAFFITDNGKQYTAYANDVWQRLVSGEHSFEYKSSRYDINYDSIERDLEDYLFSVYKNLETDLTKRVGDKRNNKLRSFDFRRSRIEKIGIENIKESKLKKLQKEEEEWTKEFNLHQRTLPKIKQLLSFRIDAE